MYIFISQSTGYRRHAAITTHDNSPVCISIQENFESDESASFSMAFTGGSVLSILQRADEETAGGQGVLVSNGGALDAKDLDDSGFRRTSGSLGEDRGLGEECEEYMRNVCTY